MNFRYIFVMFVFFCFNLFSATPTVEDLFKNVGNQGVTSNHIIVKFVVEESADKLLEDGFHKSDGDMAAPGKEGENTDADSGQGQKTKLSTKYVSWTFSIKGEGRIELLQEVYGDSSMKGPALETVGYLKDFNTRIKDEKSLEKSIFYALMSSLVLNDSKAMVYFLKKHENAFLTNQMLLDREKIKLLEEHKRYLAEKKRIDKNSQPEEEKDDSKKNQVNTILNDSIYQKNNQVTLARVDGSFFWSVDLPKFKALFKNDNHELYRLDFTSGPNSTITSIMGNYLLFDGIHQLPKRILFKTGNDQSFVIRMIELKHNTQTVDLTKINEQLHKTLEIKERNVSKINKDENQSNYFFVR